MRIINQRSTLESQKLAYERGNFDSWEDSKWSNPTEYPDWFSRHTGGMEAANYADGFPIRNHNTTTIAPTGTTSMIGDTSGGCEPVYSVAYYKNVGDDIQGDDFLVEFDSYFIKTLEVNGIDPEPVKAEAEEQMQNDEFDGVAGLDTVPDEFGNVFVTTEQISPDAHTLMQRRLQPHVDSGISKTINLPSDATLNDVKDAYLLALSHNAPGKPAKGITVYRDGSRDEQVKSTTADMDEAGSEEEEVPDPIELYQSDEWSDEEVQHFLNEIDVEAEVEEVETKVTLNAE
jgi:ribonucleoside-diphosphate reductase alpha chain